MTIKRFDTSEELVLNRRNHDLWRMVITPIAAVVVFIVTYFLILPAITMSSQDTHCGYEEHTHLPECYDEQGELICGLEEHTHSLVCYSDYDAEIESVDIWQQELPELTGNRSEDVLAVAKSLMGYRESDKNYMVTERDETKGYTRFGHWYGIMVDDILKEATDEITAEVIREIDADLAADETGEKTQQFLQEVDDYLANAPAASDAQENLANASADFDAADGQTYADDTANAPADYDAADGQAYAPADYDAEENQAYADGTANAPASYDGAEDQTNVDGADAFANEEGSAPVQAEDLYAVPDDLLNGIADFAAGNVTPERAAEIARFIGGLRANDIASRLPGKLSEKLVGVSADDIARGHCLKHDNGIPDYSYWDWDAMFASYVMSYSRAGDMGADADAASWAAALAAAGRYVDAPDYIPSEGDLVFFAPYADEPAVVGIVSDINKSFFGLGKVNSISVICGDFDNEVSEIRIAMEEYKEGDLSAEIIQGYGLLNTDEPSENVGDDASGTDSSLDTRGDVQNRVPADTHVSDEAAMAAGDESFADRMDESDGSDLSNGGKPEDKKSLDSSDADSFIPNDMACTMLPGEMRTLTADGSDYTVTMTYGAESEIPDIAKLLVKEIKAGTDDYEECLADTRETLGINDENADKLYGRFFDIKIMTKEGEFEPKSPVKVEISYKKPIEAGEASDFHAIHFGEEGTERINVETSGEGDKVTAVEFAADSFSVYGVVYTVDFHWTVDGKEYEISIPGGGFISLEALVETLGISKNGEQQETPVEDAETGETMSEDQSVGLARYLNDIFISDETKEFVEDVANVMFSNPELVWVGKIQEDVSVGDLKDRNELYCQYSDSLTEEEITEINERIVSAGDWAVISLLPFDTEESLTVTMKNGDVFVIKVTDEKNAFMNSDNVTVQTIPNPSGTSITMFDYWLFDENEVGRRAWTGYNRNSGDTYGQNFNFQSGDARHAGTDDGINKNHKFKFVPSADDAARDYDVNTGADSGWTLNGRVDGINSWNGRYTDHSIYNGAPTSGIITDALYNQNGQVDINGYPRLNAALGGESLDYLFNPATSHEGKRTYSGANNLFYVDPDGYYTYESMDYYATMDKSTSQFTLTEAPEESTDQKHIGFWAMGDYNYWFGMHMRVEFSMPTDGLVLNPKGVYEPMQFEFAGDDDAWVFIDGILVADGGGIHNRTEIDVNFQTGNARVGGGWYENLYAPDHTDVSSGSLYEIFSAAHEHGLISDEKWLSDYTNTPDNTVWVDVDNNGSLDTFAPGTGHTFDFFYLERGGGESNLYIHYNLVSTTDFTAHKAYQYQDNPRLRRDQFQFELVGFDNPEYADQGAEFVKAIMPDGLVEGGDGTFASPLVSYNATTPAGLSFPSNLNLNAHTSLIMGCTEDGNVNFGDIQLQLSQLGKEYYYAVREIVPGDAVNRYGRRWDQASPEEVTEGGFKKDGITYDGRVYYFKGTVVETYPGSGEYKLKKTRYTDETYSEVDTKTKFFSFINGNVLPATLEVVKQDDDQHILQNAEFSLTHAMKTSFNQWVRRTYVDGDGQQVQAELRTGTTSAYGILDFDDLLEGHYILEETAAPPGYEKGSTYRWLLTLTRKESIHGVILIPTIQALDEAGNILNDEVAIDHVIADNVAKFTVLNTPKTVQLTLEKKWIDSEPAGAEAKFELLRYKTYEGYINSSATQNTKEPCEFKVYRLSNYNTNNPLLYQTYNLAKGSVVQIDWGYRDEGYITYDSSRRGAYKTDLSQTNYSVKPDDSPVSITLTADEQSIYIRDDDINYSAGYGVNNIYVDGEEYITPCTLKVYRYTTYNDNIELYDTYTFVKGSTVKVSWTYDEGYVNYDYQGRYGFYKFGENSQQISSGNNQVEFQLAEDENSIYILDQNIHSSTQLAESGYGVTSISVEGRSYASTEFITGTNEPDTEFNANPPYCMLSDLENGRYTFEAQPATGIREDGLLEYYSYHIVESDTNQTYKIVYVDDHGNVVLDTNHLQLNRTEDGTQTIYNIKTVDVPVEKSWDDIDNDYTWEVVFELDELEVLESGEPYSGANTQHWRTVIGVPEKRITNSSTDEQKTFTNLPLYKVYPNGSIYRIMYSVDETEYILRRNGQQNPVSQWSKTGGLTTGDYYIPAYIHDAGDLDDNYYPDDMSAEVRKAQESFYHVVINNHMSHITDEEKLNLTLKKEWTVDIQSMLGENYSDAYAVFRLKRYQKVTYREYDSTDSTYTVSQGEEIEEEDESYRQTFTLNQANNWQQVINNLSKKSVSDINNHQQTVYEYSYYFEEVDSYPEGFICQLYTTSTGSGGEQLNPGGDEQHRISENAKILAKNDNALKMKKIVTVDGHVPNESNRSLVDGAYDFSIVGPASADAEHLVTKYVRIIVLDGMMVNYDVIGTKDADYLDHIPGKTELAYDDIKFLLGTYYDNAEGWIPGFEGSFEEYDTDRWVVIPDLDAGDYVVTEIASYQLADHDGDGTPDAGYQPAKEDGNLVPLRGVCLTDIEGGKEDESLSNRSVTVTVAGIGSEATDASWKAAFTNDYSHGNLSIRKIVRAHECAPVSGDLDKVEGTYTFTVFGPVDSQNHPVDGAVTKYVQISAETYLDGSEKKLRYSCKVNDKDSDWDQISATTASANAKAIVENLRTGDYIIKETPWIQKPGNPVVSGASMNLYNIKQVSGGSPMEMNTDQTYIKVHIDGASEEEVGTEFMNELAPSAISFKKMVADVNDSSDKDCFNQNFSEDVWEDSADYDIGDSIQYRIMGYLPITSYKASDSYYYRIDDVMQNQQYVDGSGHVFAFFKGPEDDEGIWYQVDEYFTITVDAKTGNVYSPDIATTVTPSMVINNSVPKDSDDAMHYLKAETSDLKNITRGYEVEWGTGNIVHNSPDYEAGWKQELTENLDPDHIQYIQFRYNSQLLASANVGAAGNANDARLYYHFNDGDYHTGWDRNRVFTYRLQVLKTYEDDTQGNERTEFSTFALYKKYKDDNLYKPAYEAAPEPIAIGKDDKAIIHAPSIDYLPTKKYSSIPIQAPGDFYYVGVTESNGTEFEWKGLDDGEYILVELSAPDEYEPMSGIIEFSITAGHSRDSENPALDLSSESSYVTSWPESALKSFEVASGDAEFNGGNLGADIVNVRKTANATSIEILKIDEETRNGNDGTAIAGASFRLLKREGVNYVAYDDVYGDEEGVPVGTSGENRGKLVFENLPNGDYIIEEVYVPEGYVKTERNDIHFTIASGVVTRYDVYDTTTEQPPVIPGSTEVAQITYVCDSVNAITTFIVGNTPGAALPATGGQGTAVFYAIGAIMALSAGWMLMRKRAAA